MYPLITCGFHLALHEYYSTLYFQLSIVYLQYPITKYQFNKFTLFNDNILFLGNDKKQVTANEWINTTSQEQHSQLPPCVNCRFRVCANNNKSQQHWIFDTTTVLKYNQQLTKYPKCSFEINLMVKRRLVWVFFW